MKLEWKSAYKFRNHYSNVKYYDYSLKFGEVSYSSNWESIVSKFPLKSCLSTLNIIPRWTRKCFFPLNYDNFVPHIFS